MEAKKKDKYDFGEKETENINGQKIPVDICEWWAKKNIEER